MKKFFVALTLSLVPLLCSAQVYLSIEIPPVVHYRPLPQPVYVPPPVYHHHGHHRGYPSPGYIYGTPVYGSGMIYGRPVPSGGYVYGRPLPSGGYTYGTPVYGSGMIYGRPGY